MWINYLIFTCGLNNCYKFARGISCVCMCSFKLLLFFKFLSCICRKFTSLGTRNISTLTSHGTRLFLFQYCWSEFLSESTAYTVKRTFINCKFACQFSFLLNREIVIRKYIACVADFNTCFIRLFYYALFRKYVAF